MKLEELYWDDRNIEKVHGRATPEEVEEAVFDPSTLCLRVTSGEDSEYRRYAYLGLTDAGRFLAVFVDHLGRGVGRPISVRDMDDKERRRFKSRGK